MPKQQIVVNHQFSLALIPRKVGSSLVEQRAQDGYINAAALCAAAGKKFRQYRFDETNANFIRALCAKEGLSEGELIQGIGTSDSPEVWVHPKVSIHLAQWLSPTFAVTVADWVYDWLSGKGAAPAALPAHLTRYVVNDSKIPTGYFSILQETTLGLTAPLHHLGFVIPAGWVPDISVGRTFCKWLREEKGVDTDALPKYDHEYQDSRGVQPAKLYPDSLLAEYRVWFRNVWLPVHGAKYFEAKDPNVMQYFDQLPAIAGPKAPANELSWKKSS